MALRIGQSKAIDEPKVMAEMPMKAMPEEMPMHESGTISPEAARYFGPESRCEGCIHFMAPGSCEIVAGPIDPQGVCMIYEADDEGAEAPEQEATEVEPTE